MSNGMGGRRVGVGRDVFRRSARARYAGRARWAALALTLAGLGAPPIEAASLDLPRLGLATQSGDLAAGREAGRAVDGSTATFSATPAVTNAFWEIELNRTYPLSRVEVVASSDNAYLNAASGLTLRIFDLRDRTAFRTNVLDPGSGATWAVDLPAGVEGRILRFGLEDGQTNGAGQHQVVLAEVRVFGDPVPRVGPVNLALGRESYAIRFEDSLPPASYANDGNLSTEFKSTDKSVDAYWEVDLGEPQALSTVRVVAAAGFTARLAHATVRLFDAQHESVFSQHLKGTSATFDVDLAGPRSARFVRVGFENKERSDPGGGIEWYLGLKEVQVFGQPAAEVGLLAFTASSHQINSGQTATLAWRSQELHRLDLHPGPGSVGAFTGADGTGAFEVTPAVTTEFWLIGTNRNGAQPLALTVEVDGKPLPIQISEFVANNRLSLEDGRNEAPDWIELHNPNHAAVNLAGYGLSDDPALPMKWIFPATNLPPHGYVVVFASGRSEPFDAGGFLHASFQLEQDGESIVLTAPDGTTVVDAVLSFPPQREDLAYGRTLGGEFTFLEPTPGRLNLAATYAGWLRPLTFSQARGFQTNAFSLSISNANEGAQVFYSLNGREPSTLYGSPLSILSSTCVRAAVRRAGFKEPPIQTHSFLFPEKLPTAANMNPTIAQDARYRPRVLRAMADLPTVSIAVPQLPDDYVERAASVEIFWPDGASSVQANCGFFRFGGAWTTFAKKNYRLKFRAEYGDRKLRAPLFRGFDRGFLARDIFDEIDLGGGSHDMVERGFYLASRFAEDTLLEMGSLNPHGRFVNVFINGSYWGQYHARERLTDAFLADNLGGRREDYVNVRGNDNVGSSFILGTPEPPNRLPWDRVRALRGSYQGVRPYLDVSHLIDFMLMWGYGDAETEYRAAGPLAAGSGFKFWLGDADGYLRTSALGSDPTGNAGPGGLFGALVAERDPDFMTLLADRIQQHCFLEGALTPARNLARLNARMNEITNSLVAECARWGFRTPDNWESAAQAIRTGLFPARTRNLVNALRGRGLYPVIDPPTLNQHGGSVSNGFVVEFSANAESIYYTLDGSDPRQPGGAVNPAARVLELGLQSLVPAGSGWRYWDRGSLPAPNWHQPEFSDLTWSSGRAQLGYGDGGEATLLGFGPDAQNKYSAYYFRHAFVVSNPANLPDLVLDLVRDDGAVVYLNGREVVRDNMPSGPIDYATRAPSAVGGADESTYFRYALAATNLVAGTNWLAVEVHQVNPNSTDLSFDLALLASSTTSDPTLVLQSNTVLRARTRSGTTWSALIEARFLLAVRLSYRGDDLPITEIHYNPDGPDDCEFVEFHNTGTNLLDLGGARLEGGIDFLFPAGFLLAPGGFALVVEDAAAFAARYQATNSPWYYPDLRVAGEWSGRLDDSGDRIALLTSERVEAFAVTYRSDASWPQRADGKGSSLELRTESELPADAAARTAYLGQGRHWRSSSLYHGSPGRLDEERRPVVISEVLAHTDAAIDWIELYNPTDGDADLYGMFLSDHYGDPFRYAFPEGALVPAGGFLVLNATQLGFGLSELGSNLLLTEASGTNLSRFVDTVDFTAVDREETVGRYERSDGLVDFTELRTTTFGTPNAPPRVGPVVFSEIMYRPAPGLAEYVELVNVSNFPVALFDPARRANTWNLSGAVEFAFPPDQAIAPGVPVIVCSTNPAAFRAQYGLGPAVVIYGPWTGSLDNAGESVKLNRPGAPEPDGTVPLYRVDRVRYEPAAPWPFPADLGGTSLERLTLGGYGNDPANWRASTGGGTPGLVVGVINQPPVLGPLADLRYPADTPLRLLLRASDPDQPPQQLAFSQSGLPTGMILETATGWIVGRAPNPGVYVVSLTVADDQEPALTDSGQFTLTITAPFMFQPLSAPGEEPRRFQFQGLAGNIYEIQASDSLESADWRLIQRVESTTDGFIEFTDPQEPAREQRFYRVLWLTGP